MYYSMDAVTQRQSNSGSGAASAVALGVLCGVLAALAIQPASHSSAAAWAAPPTAAATRLAAPRTLPVQRVTPALSGRTALAATAVDPAGHAPLDPLMLNGPPAPLRGPARALLILVGAMLLPAVGLVLLYRKLCVRSSSVALEEEFDEERMSMAAAAALDEEEVETAAAPAAPKPQSKRVKPPYAHFSKRRRALESMYQRKQLYPLEEALRLAKETSSAKFTESIDVAVNLGIDPRKSDQMVRGSVVLPAGTGKVVRVAAFCQGDAVDKAKAAGAEFYGLQDLAELIKGGELGFDVVVATPDAMRVALQLGKILGPRGLMPNPKDGTVNVDIEQAIRNAKAGQVKYRSDKAGSIHIPVGKTNFDIANLKTNVNAFLKELIKVKPATVKGLYMKKVVVSSTMGPGIYVDIGTTEAAR